MRQNAIEVERVIEETGEKRNQENGRIKDDATYQE